MIGQPIRSPLRAVLTHILCRSCHRKTPFVLSQGIERHLPPRKQCRPVGFRYADFSAPDPSALVRPYRGCFAVLSALIRSLLLGSPLRAELSFSLPKPFPRLCVRQSLIYYGSPLAGVGPRSRLARGQFFTQRPLSDLISVSLGYQFVSKTMFRYWPLNSL